MFLLLGCLTAPESADSAFEAGDSAECASCVTWYGDTDGDGFGDDAVTFCACEASEAFPAAVGGDCDDHEAKVSPVGTELCGDWADNDCDGLVDEDGADAVDPRRGPTVPGARRDVVARGSGAGPPGVRVGGRGGGDVRGGDGRDNLAGVGTDLRMLLRDLVWNLSAAPMRWPASPAWQRGLGFGHRPELFAYGP